MTYWNRYILRNTLLLTAWLACANAIADVRINGNVYGGGNLADVQVNTEVKMAGGIVAKNVFGGGKGKADTFTCEKAMVGVNDAGSGQNPASEDNKDKGTTVTISAGTVNGSVYGGGEVGRVEWNTQVTLGVNGQSTGDSSPVIAGNVFGAGKGLETHGYSALVRGNSTVTIQGKTEVGGSAYGGGEIASVGRFKVVGGLPSEPDGGGTCKVTVKDHAKIGDSGTTNNVFGTCKGFTPAHVASGPNRSKCMQTVANKPEGAEGTTWDYYVDESGTKDERYIWKYLSVESDYLDFLHTLALASHSDLEIDGNASVYGSVYGGGQRGITLGNVSVDIKGGTVYDDVYGGGALADTNKGNGTAEKYDEATVTVGETVVTGMYTRSVSEPYTYTKITTPDTKAASGTTYYTRAAQSSINTTTVNLTGGLIKGDAYGGGLGQKTGFNGASSDIPAVVWGDINVTLNGTAFDINYYSDEGHTDVVNSGRVFGCNNLLGSPKGDVKVTVYRTVAGNTSRTVKDDEHDIDKRKSEDPADHSYELAAVYGGGNLAPFTETGKKTNVIIHGCDATSILTVYGGGNAAAVPETDVDIVSCFEIGSVFGGGNGKDDYKNDAGWQTNPGADISGNANTMIYGGTVHEAYGGSNEKGTIYGSVAIDISDDNEDDCPLDVAKIVGAGKNADVNGDLILVLGCKPTTKIPLVYGGADNANVNGDVELTITSGNFGKVFGGNNQGGFILGHIKLNIEETGDCDTPINIDELYLGGNEAEYSMYGYYQDGTDGSGNPIYKSRTAAIAAITDPDAAGYKAAITTLNGMTVRKTAPYAQPELNVISCTSIGQVFGGGYGAGGTIYGDPIVNINMIPGSKAALIDRDGNGTADGDATLLGEIGDIFGGGNAAPVEGNTTVNIGTETSVTLVSTGDTETVRGANIKGSVYGGGNAANVTGNTNVNICAKYDTTEKTWESVAQGTAGVSIDKKAVGTDGGTVYGGGCLADVKGNTFVRMYDGYVMDRVYGGGNKGNVGSFTTTLHSGDDTHDGCIGKPNGLATENTGKCTVEISGGQVGPTGMTMPDDYGYVFGAGRGETRDPAIDKDIEFKTYVYETDVTIKNTYADGHDGDAAHITNKPLICGGVYGGSERGRVLHDTNVKIQGGQIGCGAGKNSAYAESLFINPATATLSEINTAAGNMTECASWTYDKNTGTPYDEHAGESWYASSGYGTASTTGTDGHTFYGNVFGGGSGYFPYEIRDNGATNGYEWLPSAGLVEGDTHLTISGGHILTNAYGGNELTDVTGTCYVTMTGGTLGVPRTLDQIAAHPVTCYLFGAGKGDQRIHFNKSTNVGNAVVNISGGIIYGSVFGGGEDGHVKGNVTMNISETDATNHPTVIGTLGTSYVDGNVFGAGRGFSGDAYTAGNVAGSVTMNITGGRMLGSVYGGGRLGSVGYGLYDVDEEDSGGVKHYGEMRPDNTGDDAANTTIANFPRGYVTIDISGGTIGNNYEYVYPTAAQKASNGDLRNTSYDTDNKLLHTKGGNVFAGGMGRREKLDGVTPIDALDWRKLGNVKSTKITVSGGTIKSSVFGGGEIGAVVGTHTTADSKTVGTEVIINGGTIGTQIPAGSGEDENTYFFGNVFGGGYGTEADASLNITDENKLAALVSSNTSVKMTAGIVRGSVYGGGNVACVGGNADVSVSGGEIGYNQVNETDNEGYVMFGNWRMGNVFGSGRGSKNTIIAGLVKGNTNINISEADHENNPTFIYHNVYGGGALGSVGTFTIVDNMPAVWTENTGTATINITGGTIGISGRDNGMVNGSSRGDISAPTGTPAVDVYDRIGWINNSVVNVSGTAHIKGSLYGGGENGHNAGNATVTMSGGTVGIIDPNDTWYSFSDPTIAAKAKRNRGNVFGGGCGTDTYESDKDGNGTIDANEKDFHNPLGGIIMGNATVNISGGTVRNNVYGGGSMGSVDGNTTITVTGGRLGTDGDGNGNVCGGPKGLTGADIDAYTGGNSTVTVNYSTTPTGDVDTNNDGVMNDVNLIAGSVFGGGEAGIVKGSVTVNMEKGLVLKDVYGGGALAHTNTNNVTAGLGTASPTLSSTTANTTTVSLLGGTINGFAYGGGLGSKPSLLNPSEANIPAYIYGDVKLNLNGMESGDYSDGYSSILEAFGSDYAVKSNTKGCVVRRVFGCNNVNGTPKGDVKVNVWATQHASKENVNDKCAKESGLSAYYDVNAVYGGGNEAAYSPLTGKKPEVNIHNCDLTSIEYVYGGGNAAAVPETHVNIYGAYEIYNAFGGGNGRDRRSDGSPNPGADVVGSTNTKLKGGRVHEAYGGSNTLGNIGGSINIASDSEDSECTLENDKIVSAGKNADINNDVNVILGCVDSHIAEFYAGADQANVNGHVNVTITSGSFGKFFGGNNLSGMIKGYINLNIEETGCTPIIIDELYLGGNQAAYSKYGYYIATSDEGGTGLPSETPILTEDGQLTFLPRTSASDPHKAVKSYNRSNSSWTVYTGGVGDVAPTYDEPELNITSCTSIGNVYGGGYGSGAVMYANPTVNINMIPGDHASTAVPTAMTSLSEAEKAMNPNKLGVIGNVFGGGNEAKVEGNTTVNIGMATTVTMTSVADDPSTTEVNESTPTVLGAFITGNVFGGGDEAEVTGDTHVNICGTQVADATKENGYTDTAVNHSGTADFGVSIGNTVYGGGNAADVKGNTFVTFAGGYVFNGVFGGGLSGSVGTFTTSTDVTDWGHTANHDGCIGKPTACASGTGTCYVVVSGGQIGPVEVATQGMNRKTNGHGDPVPQGWVWGAGCGLVEDPSADQDTHFKTYVNNTDITIKDDAFILESIIGGGEFGRVLGNTLVKIEGGQIGVGENQTTDGGSKPLAYTAAQWAEAEAAVRAGDASRITTIAADMPECSYFPYGRNIGTNESPNWVYDTYDPYADEWKATYSSDKYVGGSTDNASDGKTWIGCVFAGGSGYMPYVERNSSDQITDYDWVPSAGWVGGDTELRISGGHILTNVYGGNEYTDVKGKCKVTMTGGTIGVPRTVDQILAHPLTCYLFGAGKGDPRVHFNKATDVGDVEINITGGTIFGSVFGGGEDGHVMRDVKMTIGADGVNGGSPTGPFIGTWGTSYVDGNVFGGGRGFTGEAYTAGNIGGSVKLDIKGGTMLGSIYGGGRLGSVGYGLFESTDTSNYGVLQDDNIDDKGNTTNYYREGDVGLGRGHIDITISGGTIGNDREYIIPKTGEGGNTPNTISETDFTKWTTTAGGDWDKWKQHNNIPRTEFDTSTGRLLHTKGGNVFAGGMGNLYKQDGMTPIDDVKWWKLGCVKSTKLTITGGTIKSSVYGGGEIGWVGGTHPTTIGSESKNVSTEVNIYGDENTQIGTEVKDASNNVQYTYGSVFGGGYGNKLESITDADNIRTYPKFQAGRVKNSTKVDMTGGNVLASVYGGGEMANVGFGFYSYNQDGLDEDPLANASDAANTYVTVSGGTIGKDRIVSGDNVTRFGGATMGNVYGGGSGLRSIVRCGLVLGNTNVNISGSPTIYHNVYGGGAYGTVGDYNYETQETEATQNGVTVTTKKVFGIHDLHTSGTGVANITITGGTLGTDGCNNGMVFGSSRGDVVGNEFRDDYVAWVYDTHVTIGNSDGTGPSVKGSVYGSGENGHVFHDTDVLVQGGTIGIADGIPVGGLSGASYPSRGNVYGSGCGSDTYTGNDGKEYFNPLAGVVYGNTSVRVTGGTVVHNVYGAGSMGSVGRTVTTTGESGTTTTYTGGLATVNINGGTIGHSGTVGDGNVFGAARGDLKATGDYISQVRKTNVNVSSGQVKGNVYGGGELGDVGTIDKSDVTNYNYNWKKTDGTANDHCNNDITGTNNNTGICTVTVTGGTIGTNATTANADGSFDNGNVYGGGKGSSSTWWCEKAIAYATDVTITGGTVHGSVYGGGEVGRVEDDAKVTIGTPDDSGADSTPTISGSVFGAGKGLKTHGYSALVRGNANVIVQGKSVVSGNVFGGGEIASVGKFFVEDGLPKKPLNGGTCTVLIQDEAKIGTSGTGHNVFGACKGVNPAYDVANYKNFKSMQTYDNRGSGDEHDTWDYYENYPLDYTGHKFVWKYYKTEADYLAFLKTLALTSNTHVTIDEDADIYGSVFGGGESGVTLGGVDVNIVDGIIHDDVYGGGSLADSNSAMRDADDNDGFKYVTLDELIPGTSATGYYSAAAANALITDANAKVAENTTYYANYKTNVRLKGGTIEGSVYGGGLGRLAKAAVAAQDAVLYTAEDAEVIAGTKEVGDVKTPAVEAQAAVSAVEAKVYGDVLVTLNGVNAANSTYYDCVVKDKIFGCNNLNGSPQSSVTVHVYNTTDWTGHAKTAADKLDSPNEYDHTYNVAAVYGGGNLAAYKPDLAAVADTAKTYVIIDGCQLTSIKQVYGGGNAASAPATKVTINGTYEIDQVFGGGNGRDAYTIDDKTYDNPGANVGYSSYAYHTWDGTQGKYVVAEYGPSDGNDNDKDASTKEKREDNYPYGSGETHVAILGGTVHSVYGGSNAKGNVREKAVVTLDDEEYYDCDFNVDEAYGGGKNAEMDGHAILEMLCISGLKTVYGGAENADVNNDVVLNITNGTYDQVFGGNNIGGRIQGSITVNIEETGCKPIIIGELYGGGNQAGYSVYGYKAVTEGGKTVWRPRRSNADDGTGPAVAYADPQVNVKSFTAIGHIFGGGFGADAVMVANPHVNVDVIKGKFNGTSYAGITKDINGHSVTIPNHEAGKIGAIQKVFGGGNAAEVVGTPHVNIGTQEYVEITTNIINAYGFYTRTGAGTNESPYVYTEVAGVDDDKFVTPVPDTHYYKKVEGADIRGDVFGGGNNAEVTGNTSVTVGRRQ